MSKRKQKPNTIRDNVEVLLDEAMWMPTGSAQVAVLEEAVRLADSANDIDLGYEVRLQLTDAANFANRSDLLLVHFAWCLAQMDRNPGRFNEFGLLWRYKWVCSSVLDFPDVPLTRIEELTADMEARFERAGFGRRAVWDHRLGVALHRGDKAGAMAAYHRFIAEVRDPMSNCAACEADEVVRYHISRGRYAAAVDLAGPILAGRLVCRTVPQRTYSRLLEPLLRLGRPDDAARYHRSGLRTHARHIPALHVVCDHIRFLTLTDNLAAAVTLAGRWTTEATSTPELLERFGFWLTVAFLAARLRLAGRETVRLPLPTNHPLYQPKGPLAVARLEEWATATAKGLAARFDARNQTDSHARRLRGLRALHRLVTPHKV